jgi:hypothetical protein
MRAATKFYSRIWERENFWREYRRAAMAAMLRIRGPYHRSQVDELRSDRARLTPRPLSN